MPSELAGIDAKPSKGLHMFRLAAPLGAVFICAENH